MLYHLLAFGLSTAVSPVAPPAGTQALLMSDQQEQAICPVTGKALAPGQGVKVAIRGRQYTVVDEAAAEELKANPDKYLDQDGTPKNKKK